MSKGTVAQNIATLLVAIENCQTANNKDWGVKHRLRIDAIMANYAPSGAGIDNGTRFVWDKSTPEKLVFQCGFHHMDDNGSYNGWTMHNVVCTASLAFGLDIRVTGVNKNQIKEYLGEIFYDFLHTEVLDYAIDLKYAYLAGE